MANKITVTSAGTVVNASVTPDTAMYYSNKSKEWAISNRIVDNTDYSSKYYANESKKQADISTAKATEVVESGNTAVSNIESARDNAITDVNTAGATQVALATEQATIATNKASEVVASGNEALSNIDTAKNNAITSITNQETTSKTSLIDEGATQIGLIQNEGATQVANVQSTGFYMRDDKLYFINSQGEETEFKLDDIELNNPYSLFDSKYSDHELNNLSWLKSEGQWNAKAVYTSAYDKLLKIYNGTETVEGLSVKLWTDESATDYDFRINTADETFRLPLKNHTADDGKSVLTLYFYVGETVQNANLIDAGRIGEQLASKLDRGNKAEIISWILPDYTAGVAVSSPFTAQANGMLKVTYNNVAYLGTVSIYYGNNIERLTAYKNTSGSGGGLYSFWVFVNKGELYTFDTENLSDAKFYPCKGVN